jgi:hypothetical protein
MPSAGENIIAVGVETKRAPDGELLRCLGKREWGGLLGNRGRQIDPSSSVSVDVFGEMIMKADHQELSPV